MSTEDAQRISLQEIADFGAGRVRYHDANSDEIVDYDLPVLVLVEAVRAAKGVVATAIWEPDHGVGVERGAMEALIAVLDRFTE